MSDILTKFKKYLSNDKVDNDDINIKFFDDILINKLGFTKKTEHSILNDNGTVFCIIDKIMYQHRNFYKPLKLHTNNSHLGAYSLSLDPHGLNSKTGIIVMFKDSNTFIYDKKLYDLTEDSFLESLYNLLNKYHKKV